MINAIIVAQLLARLGLAKLLLRVKLIVESIEASAYFGTPSPALNDVTTARLALEDAITTAKLYPSDENKKKVKDRKRELMDLMELLRQYVQGIARANPLFAENIALAASMSLKNNPGRSAQTNGAMNTEVPGTVALLSKIHESKLYHWMMTLTPSDEDSWESICITATADIMIPGLTSVKKYYFRVGMGGAAATEVFSEVFFVVVQ